MLTLSDCVCALYRARSIIPWNDGKTFWLSWWCLEGGRAIITLQATVKDCWRDDLSSSLSFRSTGSAWQIVVGRLKWPRTVLSRLLLVKWIMIAPEMRSRLLFETLTLRTWEVCIACQSHGCPDEGLDVPRVNLCAHPDRGLDVPRVQRRSALRGRHVYA